MNRSLMSAVILTFLGIILGPKTQAQTTHPLIGIQQGDLPLILTAPHGGQNPIPGVPVRSGQGVARFRNVTDAFTAQLTEKIADALQARTGKRPYVVLAGFHRKYLDANRRPALAFENEKAAAVYKRYHEAIQQAQQEILERWGEGLLLDIHGQGSRPDVIFRGTQNGKTIDHAIKRFGPSVLNGPDSFFGQLASSGINVVPEVNSNDKEHDSYDGGYTVQTYGGQDGLPFDAIQLELGRQLRSPDTNSTTAAAIADSVIGYLNNHGLKLPKLARVEDVTDQPQNGWFRLDASTSKLIAGSAGKLTISSQKKKQLVSFARHFPVVHLKDTGDSVSVTFNAHHHQNSFGDRGFRFGLFDSAGTRFQRDGDFSRSSLSLDDQGCFAIVDIGRNTVHSSALIRQTNNEEDQRLWNGTRIAEHDNDGAADLLMFRRETHFNYSLTLVRNEKGGLDVTLKNQITQDAGALQGTIDHPACRSFDTLYLGLFASTGNVGLDQIMITYGRRSKQPGKSDRRIKVGVFIDEGVTPKVPNLIRSLRASPNIHIVSFLTSKEIKAGKLNHIDVLVHPGGSGGAQGRHLGEEGRAAIRRHVEEGGGYVGICAGAYLATSHYPWSLHILDARVVDTKHWARGHGMVQIGLTRAGQKLLNRKQDHLQIQYWQGPLLAPGEQPAIDDYLPLAIYQSEIAENGAPKGVMIGTTAIAAGTFGKGRVVCFSPHPESTDGLDDLLEQAVKHVGPTNQMKAQQQTQSD